MSPIVDARNDLIDKLQQALAAKDKRITKLTTAVQEALADALGAWRAAGSNSATKRDVDYYHYVLNGEPQQGQDD